MGGIAVERLTEADLSQLAALYRQFWGEESQPERMRATFRRRCDDPDYLFLAARRDGALVGSALGVVGDELYGDCRPFLLIEDLVVDSGQRRAGVGAALMAALERFARRRDCASILFVTEAEREDAVRFYEALGYESRPYRGFKRRLPAVADSAG